MQELFQINKEIIYYKHIIIYGSGAAARSIFLKLLQRNIKVYCFADSNPDFCDKKIMNTPVIHIDRLTDMYMDAAFIVGGLYAFTIARELEKRMVQHLFLDYANEVGVLHLERTVVQNEQPIQIP